MLLRYQLIYAVSFIGIFLAVFFIMTLLENIGRIKNPKPKSFPLVSVVIPAYNEQENIEETIRSVQGLNYPKLEILVIDDGSKDKTFKIAQKVARGDPRVKVFTKTNGGKASALNYGIARSKGSVIATLDADSFVTPDALMKMIGYLEDPQVASVTPSLKVYEPKGALQRVQHVEYLFGIFYRKVFSFLNVLHVTPGPFSIYRKEFFTKHGGFDEKNATEDTEIALRIQSCNYKIENSIDAVVYTVSPNKFRALLDQRTRWYHGLIKNLEDYKHLFSPKYGYLSLLALPAALLSVVMIFVLIAYFTYQTASNLINTLINFSLVEFDLITLLRGFKYEYLYYELTSPITFFLIILILFNILFIYLAKIHSKDGSSIKLSYTYYFAYYTYLYAIWWAFAIFYRFFGNIRWKGRKFE